MVFHRWPKLQHICLSWLHHNVFILDCFSNLSFIYFAMIYYFNADSFMVFLWYFKKNYDINYLQFFMFYSMVDKCLMTLGQQFSIFWQQAGHLEICSHQHYQPGKITFEDWISFSCYVIWIMDNVKCAIFVALIMAVAAETVIEKSDMCLVKGLII